MELNLIVTNLFYQWVRVFDWKFLQNKISSIFDPTSYYSLSVITCCICIAVWADVGGPWNWHWDLVLESPRASITAAVPVLGEVSQRYRSALFEWTFWQTQRRERKSAEEWVMKCFIQTCLALCVKDGLWFLNLLWIVIFKFILFFF